MNEASVGTQGLVEMADQSPDRNGRGAMPRAPRPARCSTEPLGLKYHRGSPIAG